MLLAGQDLHVTARLNLLANFTFQNFITWIFLILIQEDESNCMDPVSGLVCAGHGQCVCGVGHSDLLSGIIAEIWFQGLQVQGRWLLRTALLSLPSLPRSVRKPQVASTLLISSYPGNPPSSTYSLIPDIVWNARLGWMSALPSVWRRMMSNARTIARKYCLF